MSLPFFFQIYHNYYLKYPFYNNENSRRFSSTSEKITTALNIFLLLNLNSINFYSLQYQAFRNDNFLHFRPDRLYLRILFYISLLMISIVGIQLIIIQRKNQSYLNNNYGTRRLFTNPNERNKIKQRFQYKFTIEQVIQMKYELSNKICSICLIDLAKENKSKKRRNSSYNNGKYKESITQFVYKLNKDDNRAYFRSKYLMKLNKKLKITIDKFLMITPCNHLFHHYCLRKWMKVKKICPECRRKLPTPL